MWMTWLIVAFAIAMVVGPIMMIRPSPGMNKLASIRAYANTHGVAIHLPSSSSGDDGKPQRGAHYRLTLEGDLRKLAAAEPWALRKGTMVHDIHFHGLWDWDDKNRPRNVLHDDLRTALDGLPEGVSAVELNASGISMLWDEKCRGKAIEVAVDEIIEYLKRLKTLVASHPMPVVELEELD